MLTPNDIVESVKYSWISQLFAIAASVLGKIAVIALLVRIQGAKHARKTYILHFIWISCSIIGIAQIVLLLFQCRPTQKLWDDKIYGTCDDRVRAEKTGFFQGSELRLVQMAAS